MNGNNIVFVEGPKKSPKEAPMQPAWVVKPKQTLYRGTLTQASSIWTNYSTPESVN
jgi:hypothetical protein